MGKYTLKHLVKRRVLYLRRCIHRFMDNALMCSSLGKPIRYQIMPYATTAPAAAKSSGSVPPQAVLVVPDLQENMRPSINSTNSDLVSLKISLLGDCNIGKTSFLEKYVGDDEKEQKSMANDGINQMDKTLMIEGARISYSIWEVEGDHNKSKDHIPAACKDSVAILFMFDLSSRCTLKSAVAWYHQARKCNPNAIPILVGTKFDEFIQLPIDLQWTIADEARTYAKALNATLFFSSTTYNINVNKIFKFITARLFDLPWTVERNLTVGEPIIDF
ncbi:hypothetical protein ACFE04_016520 [Oxalis oulophora]